MMYKIKPILFVLIVVLGCTSKKITKPITTAAVVTIPSKVFSPLLAHNSSVVTQYQFQAINNKTYTFYINITHLTIDPVAGDHYIIVYDSLHPGWWDFDVEQCGPFFYPYEKVDTTDGFVYSVELYGKHQKNIIFNYLYNVKDSFFRKRVVCSDTSMYRNVKHGKRFPVIYDPNNKGRGKMLFEPPGKQKVIPKE